MILFISIAVYFVEKLSDTVFELVIGKEKADNYKSYYWDISTNKNTEKLNPIVYENLITCLLGVCLIFISNTYKKEIMRHSLLGTGVIVFIRHFFEALYLLNNKYYNLGLTGIVLLFISRMI
tara:strand:- start:214 stop:579 length:366 start_codon:yes stop_codon:yes gene_type:complete